MSNSSGRGNNGRGRSGSSSGGRGGSSSGGGRSRGNWRPPWFKKSTEPTFIREDEINYSLTNRTSASTGPFKGWVHYFPDEVYDVNSKSAKNARIAERFFERADLSFSLIDLMEKRVHNLDLSLCESDFTFMNDWPFFMDDLRDNAMHTLNCLGLGFHQMVVTSKEYDPEMEVPKIAIRIMNYQPVVSLEEIKAALFDKLISVKGTVIRIGSSRLLSTRLGFACTLCRQPQSLALKNGAYATPRSCTAEDCRSKSFVPLCSSPLTRSTSYQVIKIQESNDHKREGGRVPRSIEVELTEDLVDSCCPGDDITVTGIIKVNTNEETKKKNCPSMYTLVIHGVSVMNSKGTGGRSAEANLDFSIKDYYAIQDIHNENQRWRLLVNSLCPSIYGHEVVKAGLLLALVGGAASSQPSPTPKRSLIHVLIVGDPGLGKSHILHACSAIAPRGVYVCGNTTSASGLTVTLCKEPGGDFALEAGALVLANQGICCIDEFDKITAQHQALLEAMEQSRVSVAKGGVVCTLPAHTAILAAANPVGGHYHKGKSLVENLRMSAPLLSRFDLIFLILDKPDERLDNLLSEHVMALHSRMKRKKFISDAAATSSTSSFSLDASFADDDLPLSEKLKFRRGENVELIPPDLMRKYIAYVKKYVPQPKLTPEAARVIKSFFLELRSSRSGRDSSPVTTRQLESIIRLAEARAKVELREEVTEEDARDVVQLMKNTLLDIHESRGGDSSLSGSGRRGSSQTSRAKKFLTSLQRKAQLENKDLFSINEMKELCTVLQLDVVDFPSFLAVINDQGFLLKKSAKTYKLCTV